jgi:aspartyl-tRNA(Asn)/glutamyl-tRNA(Gln) amidotransferase subunit C
MIDRKTVESIAHLARLEFPESEIEAFTHQLNQILGYMEKLNELDTGSIEATSHAVEMAAPMREDEVRDSNVIERVLETAPDQENHFFRVPKVL